MVDRLMETMESQALIGQATGVLMATEQRTSEEALARLRELALASGESMRTVADWVLEERPLVLLLRSRRRIGSRTAKTADRIPFLMVEPGDKAPDFTLTDQNGEPFTLSKSLRQRKALHLIFFYPKANTPGCTAQACGLRDVAGDVGDTVIVGISPDAPSAQAKFDEKFGLGFPLLSDQDHAVAVAYGAWDEKSMYGKKYLGVIRSAFLIDGHGRITQAWPKISPKDTPTKLLAALAG